MPPRAARRPGWREDARTNALAVGLYGGFTTFSSFAYETTELAARGQLGRSAAYAAVSVALCVLAVGVGRVVAR
jgi:fluoride exporter